MNIEIANRLQKLRKENGYSQEELADKLGISRQAVSKWERAESSPDTDNLIILARLYNMSLDELLYDTESSDDIRQRTKDSICLTDDEGQSVIFKDGSIEFKNPDGTNACIDKRRIILSIIDAMLARPWRAIDGRPVVTTFPSTRISFEIFFTLIWQIDLRLR